MTNRRTIALSFIVALSTHALYAREFHVSVNGNDSNDGSSARPLRTISAAARLAHPGDVVTVHEGTYRERVTPPRGGESDARRIVYQAAPGARVVVKGSEIVRNWERFNGSVWKVTLPNSFFGVYNPYKDLIAGDWFTDRGRPHHTGEVYLNGKSLYESHLLERVLNPQPFPDSRDPASSVYTWFTESDDRHTYIYANFHDRDPNRELVEINVRDACFYPGQPGRDYITVRGFHMSQAATQWAPPTAEQIGLIGTHWSKGWIIENNVVSDSKCTGITLGKDRATGHNVWMNDRSKGGDIHYNEVVVRALQAGWSREKIGSHIVRNNVIFNCEQAGIVGSLGPAFSQVYGNHIYDIWTKRQFTGAEIAGIKFHAAIDTVIRNNRLHNVGRGIWLDWMTQGTRVSGNLLYDNTIEDLFVEVNHGPFVVDNNVFLSEVSLNDQSQGAAYAHNLIAGRVLARQELKRRTPYHEAHSTKLAGLSDTQGGDNRFYNNILMGGAEPANAPGNTPQRTAGYGLWVYDRREAPIHAAGNVYLNGARPSSREPDPLVVSDAAAPPRLMEDGEAVFLYVPFGNVLAKANTRRVTTRLLGKTKVSGLPFDNPDGSPLVIDIDYYGKRRGAAAPAAGPFENPGRSELRLKVW